MNRAIDAASGPGLRRESELTDHAASAGQRWTRRSLALGSSTQQRAVIVMRHLLGYTPGEIARALNVPRGTVNSRLRRGLDTMRGQL